MSQNAGKQALHIHISRGNLKDGPKKSGGKREEAKKWAGIEEEEEGGMEKINLQLPQ